MRRTILTIVAALAASAVHAQTDDSSGEAAAPAPPPGCDDGVYRQFDFWAGEWEVFNPAGKKAGENSITIEEKGCLLVERWTGVGGGTGQSYNFVDEANGDWRQVWVSAGATIDYTGGLNDDGEMVLEGRIAYRNGKKAPFRGTWTPNEDGTVTQHFEEYDSEKESWSDWFIGVYKPKKNEP